MSTPDPQPEDLEQGLFADADDASALDPPDPTEAGSLAPPDPTQAAGLMGGARPSSATEPPATPPAPAVRDVEPASTDVATAPTVDGEADAAAETAAAAADASAAPGARGGHGRTWLAPVLVTLGVLAFAAAIALQVVGNKTSSPEPQPSVDSLPGGTDDEEPPPSTAVALAAGGELAITDAPADVTLTIEGDVETAREGLALGSRLAGRELTITMAGVLDDVTAEIARLQARADVVVREVTVQTNGAATVTATQWWVRPTE